MQHLGPGWNQPPPSLSRPSCIAGLNRTFDTKGDGPEQVSFERSESRPPTIAEDAGSGRIIRRAGDNGQSRRRARDKGHWTNRTATGRRRDDGREDRPPSPPTSHPSNLDGIRSAREATLTASKGSPVKPARVTPRCASWFVGSHSRRAIWRDPHQPGWSHPTCLSYPDTTGTAHRIQRPSAPVRWHTAFRAHDRNATGGLERKHPLAQERCAFDSTSWRIDGKASLSFSSGRSRGGDEVGWSPLDPCDPSCVRRGGLGTKAFAPPRRRMVMSPLPWPRRGVLRSA
eukprot:scaffold923_cov288-Pavlova_lutheri.AAC.5